MSLHYYQEEMHYLHEAGKAFAEAHPEHAQLLNVDSLTDRDPYVERLFEGFALLTGRVHERLDDELPQYTEGVLSLLWPQLLRPIPSLSIIEFRPTPGMVQQTTLIQRGSEVRSAPVGDESTPCRFTTTQDVRLQPLRLVNATTAWPREGVTSLTLRFRLDRGIEFGRLDPRALRLYVHAEPTTASLVHLFLTRRVERVLVRSADGSGEIVLAGQQWVRGTGFDEGQELLPYAPSAFHGFRLLQEYLAFRQKFWFVELLGLERFQAPPRMTELDVELQFSGALPERQRVSIENLRLGCAPVVNLFRQDGEPLVVDHRAAAYRVIPDVHRPASVETYDVASVVGVEDSTGRRRDYEPYFAFRHGPSRPRWFTTSRHRLANGRPSMRLAFGGASVPDLRPEKMSLELWCTNGLLPRDLLRERMITQPGPAMPRFATIENLTQPTLHLDPPGRGDHMWRLLSHLSLGHRSVASREGLADLLDLYDWTTGKEREVNRRKIAALREVAWEPKETIRRRAVVRGAEARVKVQDAEFADEGDLCLFGEVLSRVLSAYATINSFVDLTLVADPSGKSHAWRPDRRWTSPLL